MPPQFVLAAPKPAANRVVGAKSANRVGASQGWQFKEGRRTHGIFKAAAQIVLPNVEAAMRVGCEDAIGETQADQDARFDDRSRGILGGEIVVYELDAGLDGVERLVQNYRVAGNQLEREAVSVQATPRLPIERRELSRALFVHFDTIQQAVAFQRFAGVHTGRGAKIIR